MIPHPKYCTQKCPHCIEITTTGEEEIFICLVDNVEVIPGEIDLTPGYGQASPFSNTKCSHPAPAPCDPCCEFIPMTRISLESFRDTIAAQARKDSEKVLKRFGEWVDSFDDYTCGTGFTPSIVLKKLQSLREAQAMTYEPTPADHDAISDCQHPEVNAQIKDYISVSYKGSPVKMMNIFFGSVLIEFSNGIRFWVSEQELDCDWRNPVIRRSHGSTGDD